MAGKQMDLGPTGETVRDNVSRLRRGRDLTYVDMSRELEELGRRIPPLGLRRIENGERRVDVDDLVALARVLWVDPVTMLLPAVMQAGRVVSTSGGRLPVEYARDWMHGIPPEMVEWKRLDEEAEDGVVPSARVMFWMEHSPRITDAP